MITPAVVCGARHQWSPNNTPISHIPYHTGREGTRSTGHRTLPTLCWLYDETIWEGSQSTYHNKHASKSTICWTDLRKHTYSAINFLLNPHNRHLTSASPLPSPTHPIPTSPRKGLGCLLWVSSLITVLSCSLQCWEDHHLILNRYSVDWLSAYICILYHFSTLKWYW